MKNSIQKKTMILTFDCNNIRLEDRIITLLNVNFDFKKWCENDCNCKLVELNEKDQYYYHTPIIRCNDIIPYNQIIQKSINIIYLDYNLAFSRIEFLKDHFKHLKNEILLTNDINRFKLDFPNYKFVYYIKDNGITSIELKSHFFSFFITKFIQHRNLLNPEALVALWQNNTLLDNNEINTKQNKINLSDFLAVKQFKKQNNACSLCE